MSRFALLRDLVACVERELRMRERVYPRWIDSGRMTRRTSGAVVVGGREA